MSTGIITTVAGTGTSSYSGDNGPATSADLLQPTGVTLDSSGMHFFDVSNIHLDHHCYSFLGNLYIADYGNNRIRKVTDGTTYTTAVPTLAPTEAGIVISTLAGTGSAGYSGDSGQAASATLNSPSGIDIDSSGNVIFADALNHRVRKITVSTGIITTIAGIGTDGFSGDGGQASSAALNWPCGLFIDTSGNATKYIYPLPQY